MGLPVILSSIYLFGRPRRKETDPEKCDERRIEEEDRREEEATRRTEAGEDGEDADQQRASQERNDSNSDGDSYDPMADPARRLRRAHHATVDTTSTSIGGTRTSFSSSASRRPWYRKLKDYVLPPDESESSLEKFVPNYRWTPIISGVVVPFALLLEIPGLTEHWYIRTEANQTVETKSNSTILDVGLAISMACGLLANICLILRFLEKKVKTVTLLTILFLTVHGASHPIPPLCDFFRLLPSQTS